MNCERPRIRILQTSNFCFCFHGHCSGTYLEPAIVDDEFITHDGIGIQPSEHQCRMGAFISSVRVFVVLESVLDGPPSRSFGDGSPFLTRATSILTGFRKPAGMREEEALLDEICNSLPPYWAHSVETMASGDVLRVTQAERIYCAEQFVRMLIHRHRFSEMVAERSVKESGLEEQSEAECEAMTAAQACALQIISSHLQIAAKGLMTYCEKLFFTCSLQLSLFKLNIVIVIVLTLVCVLRRWRTRYTPTDRSRSHARSHPPQLPRRFSPPLHCTLSRSPSVMCRTSQAVQRPLRVRSPLW